MRGIFLLQSQQDFSVPPQFLQIIEVALVGREKVDNNIAIIHDHPAIAGKPLLLSLPTVFGADVFNGGIGQRIDHAIAGSGTNNEIVGK